MRDDQYIEVLLTLDDEGEEYTIKVDPQDVDNLVYRLNDYGITAEVKGEEY